MEYTDVNQQTTTIDFTPKPDVCPGCGRCRVCGQPRPTYPVNPSPYWTYPYTPTYPGSTTVSTTSSYQGVGKLS